MGCNTSKNKTTPHERLQDYQRESRRYLRGLKVQPNILSAEQFRGGYISAFQFYNQFHAGFCSPYIHNPDYMLIVDFRTLEEYQNSHILTAVHHSHIRWDASTMRDLQKYSYVVFYDHDGTAAANIYSNITAIITNLTVARIEVSCILGGMRRVESRFPHLMSKTSKKEHSNLSNGHTHLKPRDEGTSRIVKGHQQRKEAFMVPWMPCSIMASSIYLGTFEQARNPSVIETLGITHVLSIGSRSPDVSCKKVTYEGLDGDKNLYVTFLAASEFIQSAIEQGGRVLIHGLEGLNRSAAVTMAYLMLTTTCLLDDVFLYIKSLRPHLQLDEESLAALLEWECSIFGAKITDPEDLWC